MSFRSLGMVSVLATACASPFLACQGATGSDLFDPNAILDLEAGVDATLPTEGGSGDPADAQSSGALPDAADAANDALGENPDENRVFCSAAKSYCAAGELCCAGRPVGAGTTLAPYDCKAACAPAETAIGCDDQGDCAAGEVCCDTNDGNGTPQTVACVAAAACAYLDTPAASRTQLCDPAKADPCPAYQLGSTCQQQGNMAPGFSVCFKQP